MQQKNGLFSSIMLYLQKIQRSPNKFKKTYKPFDFIKSCFITAFSSFIPFYNVNNNFRSFHKLEAYLDSYNRKFIFYIIIY